MGKQPQIRLKWNGGGLSGVNDRNSLIDAGVDFLRRGGDPFQLIREYRIEGGLAPTTARQLAEDARMRFQRYPTAEVEGSEEVPEEG